MFPDFSGCFILNSVSPIFGLYIWVICGNKMQILSDFAMQFYILRDFRNTQLIFI